MPSASASSQRLFHEVSARPDLFRRMSQLDVSNPRNAVVLLDGEPAELRLGDREFLQRLERYDETAPTRARAAAVVGVLRSAVRTTGLWVK